MTGKVFLDYDQAQLDREMNLRGRWPEHQSYFDRWARDSLHVRKTCKCHSDLVYGDTPGQKLDLFLPEVRQHKVQEAARNGGGTPLLAFIHGGYWKSLDKGDFSYLAPAYLERGIAFASLNYDLSPGADIGEMVAQVRRGLAWLIRQAGSYGLETSGLYVAGHSAGGHLAAMAMNPAWTADYGLPVEVIKGGLFGIGCVRSQSGGLEFPAGRAPHRPRNCEELLSSLRDPRRGGPDDLRRGRRRDRGIHPSAGGLRGGLAAERTGLSGRRSAR